MVDGIEIQEQLREKWLVFWWALSVGLLALSIARRQGLFNPFQASFLPLIRGIHVLKGFTYFLFIEILLIPALVTIYLTLEGKEPRQFFHMYPEMKGWIHICITLGGFGAVFLAYFELNSIQRDQLWNQTNVPWYTHIKIGIAAWLVSYPLVLAFNQGFSILLWHLFHHPFIEQIAVQHVRQTISNPILFSLTAIAVTTIVPFTEEFLFRGLLQNWLKQRFHNVKIAIICSSLLFAFFHYSSQHGLTNIELLSSLFLLSCMLGYIYERQRSLWAPIGLHGFFNLMSLMIIFNDSKVS